MVAQNDEGVCSSSAICCVVGASLVPPPSCGTAAGLAVASPATPAVGGRRGDCIDSPRTVRSLLTEEDLLRSVMATVLSDKDTILSPRK